MKERKDKTAYFHKIYFKILQEFKEEKKSNKLGNILRKNFSQII